MKIKSPAENRITVELSAQDMEELDITYEEMDYSAAGTRRAIWSVLSAAGKALGREVDISRKMIIEALPASDGGCTLDFTLLERRSSCRSPVLKKQNDILILGFDSASSLMDAAARMPKEFSSAPSDLYEDSGRYRLIIRPLGQSMPIRRHFEEFCSELSTDKSLTEFTAEHWNLIIYGRAAEALSLQDKRSGQAP